ncbi:MAG: SH3 domain-containing protein, partial [Gemmatimonadaceae bacterium]
PMPTGALLRASPAPGAEVLAELPGSAELRIVGVSDGWYRVATANGRRGFVPAGHLAGGYGAAAEH